MLKNSIILAALTLQLITLTLPSAEAKYDQEESKRAVYYSAVSYCLITDIMKWDCGRPCESVDRIRPEDIHKVQDHEYDTFGFIAYN